MSELISRQAAIDYFVTNVGFNDEDGYPIEDECELRRIWTDIIEGIPPEPDAISRQAAIEAVERAKTAISEDGEIYCAKVNAQMNIHILPSAQPEQRTGEWEITDAYPHIVYCSECHKRFAQTHWAVWEDGSLPRNFCPNCGAKMEGDAE